LNLPALNGILAVGAGGYATIAAAYAAGPSAGVEVVLAGDITISSSQTITMSKPLKLHTAGHQISCTQSSGFCLAFTGYPLSFEIDGNGSIVYTGAATSGVIGLQLGTGSGISRCDVHDLNINNFAGAGSVALNLVAGEDCRIDSVNYVGNQLAIQTDRASNQNSFTNNHCDLNVNCVVNLGYKNAFHNNLFQSNSGTYVVTESGVNTDYKENWWENNTDGTSASRQLLFATTDPSYSLYITIEDNIFAGCTTGGSSCNSSYVYGFTGNGQQGILKFSGNWYNNTMGIEQGFPNSGPQYPEVTVEHDRFPIYDVALDPEFAGYQTNQGVNFCPNGATTCYQFFDDGNNMDIVNQTSVSGLVTMNLASVFISAAGTEQAFPASIQFGKSAASVSPNFFLGNTGNAVQLSFSNFARWYYGLSASDNFFISYGDQADGDKAISITPSANIGLNGNVAPSWCLSGYSNFWGIDCSGVTHWQFGPNLGSGATITVSAPVHRVYGVAAISTITPPSSCLIAGTACTVTLLPFGAWSVTTGGNIAIASSALIGQPMTLIYDPGTSLWYPGNTAVGASSIAGGALGSMTYQTAPGNTATTAAQTSASTLCLTETGTGSVGAAPVWGACSGSSAVAFSSITGSTNTTAAMLVGTGASLGTVGSGTIQATTAAALASSPTLCTTGQAPTGVLANGNATGCASTGGPGTRPWLGCQPGYGNGATAVPATPTVLQSTCKNTTGSSVTITGVQCFTNNNGTSTLNVAGNTLGALLTGPITCTSSFASGTQSANVTLTNGDYLKFTFVPDGTSLQTTWVVTGTY
jgi:hypothetical protein